MRGHAAEAGPRATPSSSTPAPSPAKPCARPRRPSASCAARTRTRASSSPAAPRRSSRHASPPCPRSTASSATPRRCGPRPSAAWSIADSPRVQRQRHHVGARDRARHDRRLRHHARAPTCRCRTAATTAAPSASFPTAAGRRARCRPARWSRRCAGWSRPAIAEIVLTGVDITVLRRRPAGRDDARPAGAAHPAPCAGAARACACPPSTRSRPTRI